MTLIERIHQVHVKRSIFDISCALCVEQRRRHAARRPAWFRNLTAKDMTPGSAA